MSILARLAGATSSTSLLIGSFVVRQLPTPSLVALVLSACGNDSIPVSQPTHSDSIRKIVDGLDVPISLFKNLGSTAASVGSLPPDAFGEFGVVDNYRRWLDQLNGYQSLICRQYELQDLPLAVVLRSDPLMAPRQIAGWLLPLTDSHDYCLAGASLFPPANVQVANSPISDVTLEGLLIAIESASHLVADAVGSSDLSVAECELFRLAFNDKLTNTLAWKAPTLDGDILKVAKSLMAGTRAGRRIDFASLAKAESLLEPFSGRPALDAIRNDAMQVLGDRHRVAFERGQLSIVLSGKQDDIHDVSRASLVIDVGGNEVYQAHSAIEDSCRPPVQVVIDMSGNDRYLAQGVGAFGAVFQLCLLVDACGDDSYIACSVGCPKRGGINFGSSAFGVSVLCDLAGNDNYRVGQLGLGCAFGMSVGVLMDGGGDDNYRGRCAAMGVGINGGVGCILDLGSGSGHFQPIAGSELGFCVGVGSAWRGEAYRDVDRATVVGPGGVGFVCGGDGHHQYVGHSFSVGLGYAGGIGCVVDGGGDDSYVALELAGNLAPVHSVGAGCHRGIGMILDERGNDTYVRGVPGGGSGWDMGCGYLLDLAGSDVYITASGAPKLGDGQAGAQALGMLIDMEGCDAFDSWWEVLGDPTLIREDYIGVGGNFVFAVLPGRDGLWDPKGGTTTSTSRLQLGPSRVESDGIARKQGFGCLWLQGARR